MAYRDLREFITALHARNDLREIRGADWNLEIGTICELNYERKGPATLFDEIAGYPAGLRILTNSIDTMPRALMALDLPPDLPVDEALNQFDAKMEAYTPIPPTVVHHGPVLENVYRGDEINLEKFPTPRWHAGDGGRYIGTGCVVILRDPDTSNVHLGVYRVMVHDKTTAGLYISSPHKGAWIRKKYWEQGKPCPVAVALGEDVSLFAGASQYVNPPGRPDRYDVAGYLRNSPVEILCEETTGLPIPARAEIVIAGWMPPPSEEARKEGPFGEWTGYYGSATRPEPVIRIAALYHRKDPILLGIPPVKAYGPTTVFGLPNRGRRLKTRLDRAGIQDVLDVWPLAIPGVVVVRIKQRYPGHATDAGLAIAGEYMGRFVVVVDEDIDARDPYQVLWAMGSRCDPESSISLIKHGKSSALDPRLPPDQKQRGDFSSSRAVIDACKPFHWIDQFPETNVASADLRSEALQKWGPIFGDRWR